MKGFADEWNSFSVPDWAKDDASQRMQQRVWDSLTKKIEAVQPGCVSAAVGSKTT
jgi:hypothetical protein